MKDITEYKRGQEVTYNKEIMFKGTERTTSKIVAIHNRTLLLENGDQIFIF